MGEACAKQSRTWSYTLRSAGAILFVNVPATIMTSLCRGLGRKIIPNLSRSYRAAPVCIISTARPAPGRTSAP